MEPWSRYNTRFSGAGSTATGSAILSIKIASSDSEVVDDEKAHSYPQLDQLNLSCPQELPLSAEAYIRAVEARFDHERSAILWQSFFSRWDQILEGLDSKGSSTYPVFNKVLHDLRERVQLYSPYSFASKVSQRQEIFVSHGNHGNETPPSKKRSFPKGSSDSSREKGKRPRKDEEDTREESQNQPQLDQHDQVYEAAFPEFGCPIHLHHLLNGTLSDRHACHGFWTTQMAHLRGHHLVPNRGGGHGGFILFLKVCGHCQEHVLDKDLWKRHEKHHCEWRPRMRRSKKAGDSDEGEDVLVGAWVRLYLTLYPTAQKVPNPYRGQTGWLPQDQTDRYRQQVQAILPPLSFLDNQSEHTAVPDPPVLASDDLSDAAARSVVFNDLVNSLTPQANPNDLWPYCNIDLTLLNAGSKAPATSYWNDVMQDFIARLDRVADEVVQPLDDAANYLNPTQWETLVRHIETSFLVRLNLLRMNQQVQVNARNANGVTPLVPSMVGSVSQPLYTSEQDNTSGPSTQPSTQGPNTNLSSIEAAAKTGSTSAPDAVPAQQQYDSPPPWEKDLEGVPGPSHEPNYPLQQMNNRDNELEEIARYTQRDPSNSPQWSGEWDLDSFLDRNKM
ncbi:Nn.00g101950.m01.CDS01 [Neocucurbitaria sp. VM-36]